METIQEVKNLRQNMQMINFNVCKQELNDKTKTMTTRQHDEPRYEINDYVRLIWDGKTEIGIGKITQIVKIKIQRKDMGIDYINNEYAFLYPNIMEIVRREGFDTIDEYFNALHKFYNIIKKKTMYIYTWRWV